MTATNHALTGAVIGLAIGNPWLAIPAAFASHFVLDLIPHFGVRYSEKKWLRSAAFKFLLIVETAVCVGLVWVLYTSGSSHWFLATVCAFTATIPDLLWLKKYIAILRHKAIPRNRFYKFHNLIQWYQKPFGAVVEVAWALLCVTVLSSQLIVR